MDKTAEGKEHIINSEVLCQLTPVVYHIQEKEQFLKRLQICPYSPGFIVLTGRPKCMQINMMIVIRAPPGKVQVP